APRRSRPPVARTKTPTRRESRLAHRLRNGRRPRRNRSRILQPPLAPPQPRLPANRRPHPRTLQLATVSQLFQTEKKSHAEAQRTRSSTESNHKGHEEHKGRNICCIPS